MDDKAKLKAFSIENDSAGWLKRKLFKKVRGYYGYYLSAAGTINDVDESPPPPVLQCRHYIALH